tara:strand:- start:2264 stop:2566 length:303 start_codon:yes stop_codon:yes gene_type:complete
MKKELKEALASVLIQSEFENIKLTVRESTSDSSVLLMNKSKAKLGLIGLTEESGIHAFTIDVYKWRWADEEGFTFDQIIEDLTSEIFTEVRLHELVYKLS